VRKIVIAIMGTLSALVLVVSFDASRRGEDVATAAGNGGSDGGAAVDDGSPMGDGASGSPTLPADNGKGQQQQQQQQQQPKQSATAGGGGSKASGTFTGAEANTRWGIVQVRITVKNGRITKAKAIQYPQENHHDQAINAWAIPQLQQMTVANQGRVDSLSGATVTSNGYQQSLQSAMDQAHL
jgi:uncharacterized protein with FMN-binding domain